MCKNWLWTIIKADLKNDEASETVVDKTAEIREVVDEETTGESEKDKTEVGANILRKTNKLFQKCHFQMQNSSPKK